MFKKFQIIGLLFALVFATAGCSKDDTSSTPTPTTQIDDFLGKWYDRDGVFPPESDGSPVSKTFKKIDANTLVVVPGSFMWLVSGNTAYMAYGGTYQIMVLSDGQLRVRDYEVTYYQGSYTGPARIRNEYTLKK